MRTAKLAAALTALVLFTPIAEAQTFVVETPDGVPLREGPGEEFDVKLTMEAGSSMVHAGNEDCHWVEVSYDGYSGWVDRERVREVVADEVVTPEVDPLVGGTESRGIAERLESPEVGGDEAEARAQAEAEALKAEALLKAEAAAKAEAEAKAEAKRAAEAAKRAADAKKKAEKKKRQAKKRKKARAKAKRQRARAKAKREGRPYTIKVPGFPRGRMIPKAAKALGRMLKAARRDGIPMRFSDTFRDPVIQQRAYEIWRRTGRNLAGKPVPSILPGYGPSASNHTKGRAVDLADRRGAIRYNTPAHRWLLRNARKFGFTPIRGEAWHWEYLRR